jgi:Dockerin type I domain
MNDNERHFDNDADFGLAPEFSEDLGRLFAPDQPIPARVDRAVAEAARRHFARPQRRIWRLRWAVPAAAAAAIIVTASLWWFHTGPATRTAHQGRSEALAVALPEADIDQNGKVDILDAFTLARHIETGQPVDEIWDFNGDGLIDRRDVDTVALTIVRLNKGV